jgi:predicted DNA-binding antitoxin AbrB/MazE fold protein
MTTQLEAVYENGVFRPLQPVQLPEHQRVTVTINGDIHYSPPDWLDVEQDVFFLMPVAKTILDKVSTSEENGRPCIILPEEFSDD